MVQNANTPQARLARAIATGASPRLIANLQKQVWVAPVATPVDTSWAPIVPNDGTANFEQWWAGYSDASKKVYDMETARTLDTYDTRQKQLQTQADRNRADYATYTGTAQAQMNRQLWNSSKEFARKLAAAGSAYGQRGILRSGLANSDTGDMTKWYVDDTTYFKTESQRQLEAGQLGYDRNYADIGTSEADLAKSRGNYTGDRWAGRAILDDTLTRAGDTAFNTNQSQQWATEQARLREQAKNSAAWITSTPSLRTWRVGGKYSTNF
jgi:hypothetical protein